jgi:hypothetical protein
MKNFRLHRQKNLFLGHLHLGKLPAKKFFFLEFLVFDYFFNAENSDKHKKVKQNQDASLFFRDFLDRTPSGISLLALIEIIYSIDIDNLPPT